MTDAQVTTAIAEIADGTPNTALEIRTLFTELFSRTPKTGTIVIKDVSNAYITANFDGTGLGINAEAGFAIVNGQNGTRNWEGRVPVAYGGTYTTIGATAGSKDAVVVEHNHTAFGGGNFGIVADNADAGSSSSNNEVSRSNQHPTTASTGVSGTDKNMQPYIVTLVTMKL